MCRRGRLDSSASSEFANEKAIGPILDLPEEKFIIEADKVGDLGSASIYDILRTTCSGASID
jgi:hypothetical protein